MLDVTSRFGRDSSQWAPCWTIFGELRRPLASEAAGFQHWLFNLSSRVSSPYGSPYDPARPSPAETAFGELSPSWRTRGSRSKPLLLNTGPVSVTCWDIEHRGPSRIVLSSLFASTLLVWSAPLGCRP